LTVAVAIGAAACDQECDCPDCPSGGGADAGVECESQPSSCEDLGDEQAQHFGCCFEGSVYWCESGTLESIDCAAGGYLCGYSETGDFMDCI
jgi:hypothetical protein